MNLKVQDALVKIAYVGESQTRGTYARPDGVRRFVIGAEKTTGNSSGERLLGLTTLDAWKASLCRVANDKGLTVHIKFRETRYFDADLLFVELAQEEARA